MRRYFQIAAILDLLLIFLFFNDPKVLLNTQIAFISSLLVVLGSYYGYSRLVKKSAPLEDRDYIDRLEDRFDLEGDEVSDAKELFEQEKQRIKQSGNFKAFKQTYRGFFSPFRLVGYLFMVVAVLVLIRKGWFDTFGFLVGLAIVPASALVVALLPEDNHSSM